MPASRDLSDELRATLLGEAREQYKAEHDRASQAFNRVGVYLAGAGVVLTALYHFGNVALHPAWSPLYVAIVVTFVATALAVVLTVIATVGRSKTFAPLPGEWLAHAAKKSKELRDGAPEIPVLDVTRYVRIECEYQMIESFAESVKKTAKQNQWRFGFLHYAGYSLAFAIGALIATGAIYGYSLSGSDVQDGSPAGTASCAKLSPRSGGP